MDCIYENKTDFLGCLVAISTSLWAMDAGEFRGETKAKIEILQKQNDQANSKIDSLEKDIRDEYKTVTDRQNEQISALQSNFDTFITLLSLIAGIGGVAFPYVMYKQNTKAQETAKKDIESWKEKTKLEFDKELKGLQDHSENAKNKIDAITKKAEIELQTLQQSIQNSPALEPHKNQNSALETVAKILRSKPQNEYTFNDLNLLAFEAYEQSKFDDALYYWRKAKELFEDLSLESAQIFFNIAVTLGQLNRTEDAIMAFTDLIRKFKDIENDFIQEQRAKAFYNKGVLLVELNNHHEAISIYSELISTFKNFRSDSIQEQRAKAFINCLESEIILGKKIEQEIDEKIAEYMSAHLQSKLQLYMLRTINEALRIDQSVQIKTLKNTFKDINLGKWNWKELDEWANNLQDQTVKKRILLTIEQFKNWDLDSQSSRE